MLSVEDKERERWGHKLSLLGVIVVLRQCLLSGTNNSYCNIFIINFTIKKQK